MSLSVNIKKDFGSFTLKTEFETDGGVLGILGESGCGKSMTLKCIAGIVTPDEGRIEIDGHVFFDSAKKINQKPQQRQVGLLFQNYALFPNMTVEQNLMMGLKAHEKNRTAAKKQISDMMERFYLTGLEKHRPSQLSGGQQQRVALARIMLSRPCLLMLDEPFSALDEFLRWNLELELADVLKGFDGPTLFVSHNRDEIYRICDRVCVMERGQSSPVVSVKELFQSPETKAAAYLSGCKNFSRAKRSGARQIEAIDWGTTLQCQAEVPEDVAWVGMRSHYVTPVSLSEAKESENLIRCRLEREIEDVFGMILMLKPLSKYPGDTTKWSREEVPEINAVNKTGQNFLTPIRMEISKEVWQEFRKKNPSDELLIRMRPEDLMLLKS